MNRLAVTLWHAAARTEGRGPIERRCEAYLDANDRASAAKFRRATSRNQHVIGRGMTRRLMGGREVSADATPFELLPGGKPVLRGVASDRCFNVSHTEGLVVVGIDRPVRSGNVDRRGVPGDMNAASGAAGGGRRVVGVDVERLDRRTSPDLAARYFAEPEIEWLDAVSRRRPDQTVATFLKIWTLKEAFIKAIGTGLRTPLDAFAFDFTGEQTRITFLASDLTNVAADDPRGPWVPTRWRFETMYPRPGYIASIAIGTEDRNDRERVGAFGDDRERAGVFGDDSRSERLSVRLRRFDDLVRRERVPRS